MKPYIVALLGCTMFFACESSVTASEELDLVVIEAFLFAGEPVDDIRLTQIVPLGADTADAPTIDDANVRLIKDGVSYALQATSDDGYYFYPGADLLVDVGDVFRLEVDYFGKTAFGETVVPEPPVNVAMDGDMLVAPAIGNGRGRGQGGFEGAQLAATWDNADERLHYVVIEGLEEDAEPIFPDEIRQRVGRFRFISEPTTDDVFVVNLLMLEDLGQHEARVYRVNDEYADLYENRTQDSRDLNEPPSNITNGLGVFSAFNSERVFFQVVRQDASEAN